MARSGWNNYLDGMSGIHWKVPFNVPEPSTIGLLIFGMSVVGLGGLKKRFTNGK
jgi:hypothetical protein